MHPIAGKCKHCRADLASARGARPQAAAALPALAGSGKPPIKADATPAPSPVRAVAAAADAAPILPPRTTGRMPAAKAPKGSLLRNWPVIVIILAGLAIATAVVIMVWPPSKDAKADTRLPPPPAPERMSTDPLAPQGSLVPQAPKAPGAPAAPTPPADPWSDPSAIDPSDPSKDPMRMFGNIPGGGNNSMAMALAVFQHACSRMTACGNTDLAVVCATTQLAPMPAPTCAAAQRCLAFIDSLDCNASLSNQADVLSLAQNAQACTDAFSC